MKTLILATAMALAASTGLADEVQRTKVEATITDYYRTAVIRTPSEQIVCQDRTGASAGDILGGIIIGGLLGKGATGQDQGAAAGAVIGGMIAADKNQGPRRDCRTVTQYHNVQDLIYDYSTITFLSGDRTMTLSFMRY